MKPSQLTLKDLFFATAIVAICMRIIFFLVEYDHHPTPAFPYVPFITMAALLLGGHTLGRIQNWPWWAGMSLGLFLWFVFF